MYRSKINIIFLFCNLQIHNEIGIDEKSQSNASHALLCHHSVFIRLFHFCVKNKNFQNRNIEKQISFCHLGILKLICKDTKMKVLTD